jgi:opacity protein-like surface antigen
MKKLLVAAFAFAVALATPSAAHAQAYLGGRIGYAFPYGTALEVAGTRTSERDLVKSSIPLQADAGLRLGPIEVGGYLSYGFATAGSQCTDSCSAKELRLGVQANLHSPLSHEREVWAGVLFGWERLKLSPGSGSDSTASGWQGGIQAGYDFAGSSFGFGPFGMLTVGQYDSFEIGNTSLSGFTKKLHGEFQVGVRGFFKL